MRPAEGWRPGNVLFCLFAIFASVTTIFLNLGSNRSFSDILVRAGLAALIAGSAGYLAGFVLRILLQDVPEPEFSQSLPRTEDLLKEETAGRGEPNEERSVDGSPDLAQSQEEEGGNQKEREGIMVSDTT